MSLTLLNHPIAKHCLDQLRAQSTPPQQFRQLCNKLTTFLAIEATRDIPLAAKAVTTPLETMKGVELAQSTVVIAIMRAGMGMVESVVQLLPDASIGYVGMERNEKTAEATSYYCKLPSVKNRLVLVVDPMLATGGSSVKTLQLVMDAGAKDVRFLCIVAAPEGLQRLQQQFPSLKIFAGALDRELDARKFILPGLGDFGDRLHGT